MNSKRKQENNESLPWKRKQENNDESMAECVLPQDMIDCIITRLPVKSIYRFKSVCKPLRQVFSSPKFVKMHRAHFPQNQSVVIYSRTVEYINNISLLKIKPDEEKIPSKLDIPFPQVKDLADLVGCCNGLLCMSFPCEFVALWNPALNNAFKCIPIPDLETEGPHMLSIGFGYNEEEDDFKVIIIAELEKDVKVRVEVYSANSDSWSTIDVGFQFSVFPSKNSAIVNGSPYWVAEVDEKLVLVCFDVRKMVLKIVPLSYLIYEGAIDTLFVDFKGDLGALVSKQKKGETVLSLEMWVFDDVGKNGWTKKLSFRPIELKVHRFLQCLENGKTLIGECLEDGKVFVFDTENGDVKEIVIGEAERGSFQVYGYTESLAYIKGMEVLV
ncbi:hypothetical protein CASFOL_012135 [Castilleja foliolosa]|uniref:F-box domain-containing protein n=1 Tax=Castilleja foliolosa TaxID=1961234 RepID=A0ABD3DPI1_9LAMI